MIPKKLQSPPKQLCGRLKKSFTWLPDENVEKDTAFDILSNENITISQKQF